MPGVSDALHSNCILAAGQSTGDSLIMGLWKTRPFQAYDFSIVVWKKLAILNRFG